MFGFGKKDKRKNLDTDFGLRKWSRKEIMQARLDGQTDFGSANLEKLDLSGLNLSGCDLRYSDLSKANLSRANLSNALLAGADLRGANLSNAIISNTKVTIDEQMSNLTTDFEGANLTGIDMSGFVESYF